VQTTHGVLRLVLWLTSLSIVFIPVQPGRTASAPSGDRPAVPPDAVWLYDDWKVEVSPTRGILLDITRQARVNAPRGRSVGQLRIWETFYQSLKSFHGTVTDTAGGVLYTIEKGDLKSGYPFSDYRLYSNDRLYSVDLSAPTFPYLVQYRYRLRINNTFFWPDWVLDDAFPRRRTSYTVAVPHLFDYRVRTVHEGLSVDSSRTLKRDITRWSAEDMIVDPVDAGSGVPYPLLYIAPESFSVARQRGSTDSWENLGRWYGKLTRKRRKLSKEQIREIESWIPDRTDPGEIASHLKNIISRNWRYVAIEVGIGGWRPHKAESVFAGRYGDCKDLTFLWLAMLDVFNIPAYPALVRARNRQQILPDFPKDWFDHVIGCAIIGSDTLWADLTAPGYPAGTLPYQSEDRYALVIGPEEGALRHTPCSEPDNNQLVRSLTGRLDDEGNLVFTLRAAVSGHKLRVFGGGAWADNDSRKAAEVLGVLPGRLQTDSASFSSSAGEMAATIEVAGRIAEWAELTRKRIIFPLEFAGWAAPQPMTGITNSGSVDQRPYPCREIDSLTIILPPGYVLEFMPQSIEVEGERGSFALFTHFANDTLIAIRYFEFRANRASRAMGGQVLHVMTALQSANVVFVREDNAGTSAVPVSTGQDSD